MSASFELNCQILSLPYNILQEKEKSETMEWNKKNPAVKKLLNEQSAKKRRKKKTDIYCLWQEEIEEKGFNRLNRLKQGLL